jgi:phosphoglycolate phosphatase
MKVNGMKYKLAIFDFDGTLADSFPWILSIIDSIADQYKVKRLEKDQLDTLRGYDPKTLMKMHAVPIWKLPFIARHVQKRMAREIQSVPMFDGIERMFDTLAQQGTRMAMVSSNSKPNISRVLGPKNSERIEFWECGVSMFGKSGKLRKVLKQSGVDAADAICIGDEIRDIEAAQKVAIPFGAVSWGYAKVEALIALEPDEIFLTVDDLIQTLSLSGPLSGTL